MFQRHLVPKEDRREAVGDEERHTVTDMVILTQQQRHTGAISKGLKAKKRQMRKQDGQKRSSIDFLNKITSENLYTFSFFNLF